mgnify:CR=1 FL=1
MTSNRTTLKAESRETGKKGILSQLRNQGRIPAVLYGRGAAPVSLSINYREFSHAVKQGGLNALMELDLAGRQESSPLVVMVKDLQTDVISHQVIHMDLLAIDMQEKVTVTVAVRLIGKPVGVTKGGLIDQPRRELEVKCLPGNIPEALEVDISALDIGDKIHVNDMKFPAGVEVPHDANFTIVSVVSPKEEEAPEVAAATPAAGEVPVVGETAAAAPEAPQKEEKKAEKKAEKAEKKG